ncbi:unnamed protein product [Boreogadus saida]
MIESLGNTLYFLPGSSCHGSVVPSGCWGTKEGPQPFPLIRDEFLLRMASLDKLRQSGSQCCCAGLCCGDGRGEPLRRGGDVEAPSTATGHMGRRGSSIISTSEQAPLKGNASAQETMIGYPSPVLLNSVYAMHIVALNCSASTLGCLFLAALVLMVEMEPAHD